MESNKDLPVTNCPLKKKNKGFVRQLNFRPAFLWEEEIEDFVRDHTIGYSLNVPCGQCKIGDERLDIDPDLSMREAYDMFKNKLPYPNNTFDTVISDPPWKMGHYFRPRIFFELIRVCKIGGKIIYNATWIPTSKHTKLLGTWIRQSSQFSNVSIISIFEKISKCPEENGNNKRTNK
jgi:hypothetical protein